MMKKRNWIKLALLSLAASVFLTSAVTGGDAATDATVKSYEDRLADAVAKQEAAQAELQQIREDQSSVWIELEQYDKLINSTVEKKRLIEGQLESLNVSIQEKTQEIEDTTKRMEARREAFLERMAWVYEEGDAGYLEILLGSVDLADFLMRIDRVTEILESDQEIIRQMSKDKESLESAKQTLESQSEQQLLVIAQLEQEIKSTSLYYEEKEQRLAELKQNEKENLEQILYNQELERQYNAELEEYLAELQRKTQSVYVGGSLAWPLDPSAYYYYSSAFGNRLLGGVPDFHLGLDIACAMNTKILAANSGTVLKSEYHYSYGEYVLIDHGGGIATRYAHMTERAVNAGDTVETGQVIGYVGKTGSATGFHLHFEVRQNGEVQDPTGYVSGPNG